MTEKTDPSRPKLHNFLAERGLDHFQGAVLLGCSGEYVRRMCLPLDNPRRSVPSKALRRQFSDRTGGAVGEGDWHQPGADLADSSARASQAENVPRETFVKNSAGAAP